MKSSPSTCPQTLIPILFTFSMALLSFTLIQAPAQNSDPVHTLVRSEPDSIKQKALLVLKNRCNVCHRKQNPFRIFKKSNVEKYAPLIEQQVFKLKRMPKDGSSLNPSEQKALRDLIETSKTKN